MKLKQRPEDFSVKESFRFDEVPEGEHRVYMMDKQKLSTFDAVARIREKFGLKPMSISYCGLKDKQGRTEQLIAVNGFDVDMQDPDLRLKFLGRTDKPLSARNITSNRFSVTVRAVKQDELAQVNLAAAEVNRLGVVNYFDDQRFGSLKHGQGFIAKDLLRGDSEAALRNYMAVPSALDRSEDAKVKKFWGENWGDWTARCPFQANKKYSRILSSLRESPRDFLKAFLQIDSDYRAMQLFTFQSYLWNEGVRRLLQLMLPREHMFVLPYQAGTLLFHSDADPSVLEKLRGLTFPLLSPHTTFQDEQIREAALWALGKDKLTLEGLRIPGAEKLMYFKHEERPVLVYPHKLVLGKHTLDEMNKPYFKLNVAFTLPPGSYATLVVKRLFHFSAREDKHLTAEEDFNARQDRGQAEQGHHAPRDFRRDDRDDRGGRRGGRDDRTKGRYDPRGPGYKPREDSRYQANAPSGGFKSRGGSDSRGGGFKPRSGPAAGRGGGYDKSKGSGHQPRADANASPGDTDFSRAGDVAPAVEFTPREGGMGTGGAAQSRGRPDSRGGGFKSRGGGPDSRGGGFKSRGGPDSRGGGFKSRGGPDSRGGGFKPRDGGFKAQGDSAPRGDAGAPSGSVPDFSGEAAAPKERKSGEGGGYASPNRPGYKQRGGPKRRGGFKPREGSEAPGGSEGSSVGYARDDASGGEGAAESRPAPRSGGFKPRSTGPGFKPRGPGGGFKKRDGGGGYPPREDFSGDAADKKRGTGNVQTRDGAFPKREVGFKRASSNPNRTGAPGKRPYFKRK